MQAKLKSIRKSVNWGGRIKQLNVLMVVALLLAALPVSSSPVQAARVQPLLLELAAQQPDQVVSVIVQKTVKNDRVEQAVGALGGTVTADLRIINAFAAELKARDVSQLARAEGVRWVSLDAVMTSTACAQCIDTANLANTYIRAIRADQVWNNAPYLQGQGIGVAVADVRFNSDYNQNTSDGYGHGTHIASIVGGDGSESGGKYIGVAPLVNIVNVKVSNNNGSAMIKDVVAGLQWVLENKDKYNIRVVNLSLNSAVAEPHNTSPLDAACEILWFNKIVVVASAGNAGKKQLYPPANDPFVIVVGATDDRGTSSLSDDVVASFSAYGKADDGFAKPDLVAPGKNITAHLADSNVGLALAHPANQVDGGKYFRMSGTSMAAAVVSGAVALLLQDEPALNPDQVKYRLMATANKSWAGYNAKTAGAGMLDIYAAVQGTTTQQANTGRWVSDLLTTGPNGVLGSTVNWNSVNWNSVNWNSVNWNSVNWNSVNWNSDYWGP